MFGASCSTSLFFWVALCHCKMGTAKNVGWPSRSLINFIMGRSYPKYFCCCWSLCFNCGKFTTLTIYGLSHYRIPYVCQTVQTDTWSFVINKLNDIFHLDKLVLAGFIFEKACYASRLQSLSCQFIAPTNLSSK